MADLALAVLGLVDGCIKLATKIVATYAAYRKADESVAETVLALEALWTKVERQMLFLRKISNLLDDQLAMTNFKLLQQLKGTLLQFTTQLEPAPRSQSGLHTDEIFRKLKFAMTKNSLSKLMSELQKWCEHLDPTWYLILLISDRMLDTALVSEAKTSPLGLSSQQSQPILNPVCSLLALRSAMKNIPPSDQMPQTRTNLTLDAKGLEGANETAIPYSNVKIVTRLGSNSRLIGSIDTGQVSISYVKASVEKLARKLQQVEPESFGFLRCYGLLKHKDPKSGGLSGIDIVYRAPPTSTSAVSLRQLLIRQEPVSASAIMRVANQLVRSVSYVHSCDIVYKNIRPDSILVFCDNTSSASLSLGPSYLLGFNQFRFSPIQSMLLGDVAWERNLYRHPQRQGVMVEISYTMQHDIYSLGVCLLEIGLWRSFVWYPGLQTSIKPVPGVILGLNLCDENFTVVNLKDSVLINDHLIGLAKKELPPRLGDIYTDIVVACLTCLDDDSEAFGSSQDLKDEDGLIVGLRYIEAILAKMSEIVL
ncbi:hypothetical protein BX600DRAFT_419453 [Xylariales sp. PMI_506]|nr:hypothetical protein BX600DRAFT_419453 [Xylariales sp. PMI_506]